jgi:hypothetical protein
VARYYVVKCAPTKRTSLVEVQVRTLFEEGWSEIDHLVRYPANASPAALTPFLVLFNRVAGQADEMGTYVLLLKQVLEQQDERNAAAEAKVETLSKELAALVEGLGVEKEKNAAVQRKLAQLRDATRAPSSETAVPRLGNSYRNFGGPQQAASGPGVDALTRSLAASSFAALFDPPGRALAGGLAEIAGTQKLAGLAGLGDITGALNAAAGLASAASLGPAVKALGEVRKAVDVPRVGKIKR